ncbi:hypothetical protein [Pseudoalteromonas sp. OANN1]|uniref:hypothetical protein n=1 Tax=Pseudoalteromonas sp. OANN1 TaxID=2954497 RepID=UPI002097BE6A|nr:hypothetical protein [Pseudoalteromonas sp. OANN1]
MANFNERLKDLDLSQITHRLIIATGMTEADYLQAEVLYRQFLVLKSKISRYANHTAATGR